MEGHWLSYLKVKDSYQRILTILNAPIVEAPENSVAPKNYDITFEDVNFFYEKNQFELQ